MDRGYEALTVLCGEEDEGGFGWRSGIDGNLSVGTSLIRLCGICS